MAAPVQKDLYILANDTPVVQLDCETAFKNLTDKEKKYAHGIARASAEGTLIVFVQVSPEAPAIFAVLHQLFAHESVESVRARAETSGWTDDEYNALLVYASGFYANGGNYKGFGDTKFIPNVEKSKLTKLLKESAAFQKNASLNKAWDAVVDRVYSLDQKHLSLGFANEGVTTYHSSEVTKADAELIDRFFKKKNIESWNTRLVKSTETKDGKPLTKFTIRLAAGNPSTVSEETFEDVFVTVQGGDYGNLLNRVNEALKEALPHTANDHQKNMIELYIKSFKDGIITDHKEASRHWIKDKGPAVESYIGFIENYRDPAGTRSEFEGFVSAVNKETSRKFQTLVDNAETYLARLPWGPAYEKDTFLKPDFTALDVIFFGSSGIPAGINIPNYDDIRQNEGFKNVSLGNVISAVPNQRIEFLSAEDEALYKKYFKDSFEVQVGLHELLGHGSGKLFQVEGDKLNFDKEKVKDLITGKPISTWYAAGETWSSKFGAISGAYEECRAEAVGYFLCCYPDIMKVFGYEGELGETVKYVNWLNEIRSGLISLEFYQPDAKKWGQAHCFARYVLLRVVQAAGQGFVTIEETTGADGQPDLKFSLDRSKIDSVGKPAIESFLKLLQAYKSTGDAAGGTKMFNEWGAVGEEQIRWRNVVVARRKPRRVFVQPNTTVEGDSIKLKTYPSSFAGVINSFVERHSQESVLELLNVWEKDAKIFGL
uniref:Dipeptidyl peptidase 3 n=1 Tax=Panagrellus redivivus TaxID=6233 RepID=A0A7E4WD76_PANRE